jgi:probable F420-dependent oxidoreductase
MRAVLAVTGHIIEVGQHNDMGVVGGQPEVVFHDVVPDGRHGAGQFAQFRDHLVDQRREGAFWLFSESQHHDVTDHRRSVTALVRTVAVCLRRAVPGGESGPMSGHDLGSGVLVALHGHGDEPASAREWGRSIAPPGWEVVAPGAPRDQRGDRSWFDSGPRGVEPAAIQGALARLADMVARVRLQDRPVVLAGFSQGAALALAAALHGAELDAVVAICAFLPELTEGGPSSPSLPLTVPVLVIGASGDDQVPAFMGEDAAAHLGGIGMPVESVVVAGGHEVGPEARRSAAEWIASTVRVGPLVSLGLPTDRVESGEELVSGEAVSELSSLYERLGFDALHVTDHPAPDERWLDAGGHHALDPVAVLSAAATCTRRILLHTNVYVLSYRNPFMAAKSLATLDVLSGGRLILGVAAGYLRPEFEALGASFEDRGARLDEALEWLPRIWSGTSIAGSGAGWSARSVRSLPVPAQRPHPRIWVGGNSTAAMRRAVERAQGWSPFPTPVGAGRALRTPEIADVQGLRGRLGQLDELCEVAGRPDRPEICFVPFGLSGYLADPDGGLAPLVAEVSELRELGVDWVSLSVPGSSRSEVAENAAGLSEALGLC